MGNQHHLDDLLAGVDYWNSLRERRYFEPDLSDLDIQAAFESAGLIKPGGGVRLKRADLWGANLRGANLFHADLRVANLVGADLRGANLEGSHLLRANLARADLREANLRGAILDLADLAKADLARADLEYATLPWAKLEETNLEETNLRDANVACYTGWGIYPSSSEVFRPTDLSATRNLTQQQVELMWGDTSTKLPPNLETPNTWGPPDV